MIQRGIKVNLRSFFDPNPQEVVTQMDRNQQYRFPVIHRALKQIWLIGCIPSIGKSKFGNDDFEMMRFKINSHLLLRMGWDEGSTDNRTVIHLRLVEWEGLVGGGDWTGGVATDLLEMGWRERRSCLDFSQLHLRGTYSLRALMGEVVKTRSAQ
jgi:hypothetical protein